MKQLLEFTGHSIYCPAANVHIDPWQPVERAIITHAHSDHARVGSRHYLAHKNSSAIMKLRLGDNISLQTFEYGETFSINGVKFSLHPAGHIIGSAQVRVEHNGEVWVVSGDYKLEDDGFAEPFETVKCNVFITESTFGLPVYNWTPQSIIMQEIKDWWEENQQAGKVSVLMGYAVGKQQRLIKNLQPFIGNVFAHGAIFSVNECLRQSGFDLPYIPLVTRDTEKILMRNAMIFAPPSADGSVWLKKFEPYSLAYCSGWMTLRGAKNRRAIDRGFVLSDHVDWKDLNAAVKATGAEKVFVTHGYTNIYARWLNEQGIEAAEVHTDYGVEEEDEQKNNIETDTKQH